MLDTLEEKQHIRLWITIACVLVSICFIIGSIFSSSNELSYSPKTKNVDEQFTMVDLGFQDSSTEESCKKEMMNNGQVVGTSYFLSLSANEGHFSAGISYEFHDITQDSFVHDYHRQIIENSYTNFKSIEAGCVSAGKFGCRMATVRYENAIKNMIPLDSEIWNCDNAYSMYDLSSEANLIFLIKNNQMIVLNIRNMPLTDEVIEKLNHYLW